MESWFDPEDCTAPEIIRVYVGGIHGPLTMESEGL